MAAVDEAAPIAPRPVQFVSVVLPCLNEEAGVGGSVEDAIRGLQNAGLPGEVVVVDNGSVDNSVALAVAAGARVVHESKRGYGAAHIAGIRAAKGDVVVMADADQTYDLERLGDVVEPLQHGAQLVVAQRIIPEHLGEQMPFLHRYLGTPVLTRVLRLSTGIKVKDSQSGYRAFWRDQMLGLNPRTSGMEYASEMLMRAARAGWLVAEIPARYRERVGESKLRTFSDGWRHLRMLLILSPHISLVLPGIVLAILGLILSMVSLVTPGGLPIGDASWLPVFLGPTLLVLGSHFLLLGLLAAHRSELVPASVRRRTSFLDSSNALDVMLKRFALVAVIGALVDIGLFVAWISGQSGPNLLGLAGLAQAMIIIGLTSIASLLGAELSREAICDR